MAPQTFGGYQILSTLGSGGMGMVYRAKDAYGRIVALKVMAPELVNDTAARMRFEREPKMHANHPNIVQIYDSGTVDRVPYFAMHFIEGKSLSRLIAEYGRLSLDQLLPVLKGLSSAMDSIHKRGIIHRDIKPSNILVQTNKRWQPFLTDFGVAMRVNDNSVPTPSGVRAGTPRYMSPEQAKRQVATAASDIYSLAVLVYESLCGRPPFDSPSETNLMEMHQRQVPPDMRALNPDLSSNLVNVVMRGMNKDPGQRYRSAGEFTAAFERAALASGAHIAGGSARRKVGILTALALMMAAGAAIVYVLVYTNKTTEVQNAAGTATAVAATAIANGEVPTDTVTGTAVISDTGATGLVTDTNTLSDTVVTAPTETPVTPTVRPTRRVTATPTPEPTATPIPPTLTPIPIPTATLRSG